MTKTSVALCTYNGEKFLREQIDSILSQTVSVDEIVVCDDGSTDSTIQILDEYQKKYPNIFKIHQNEKNLRSVKNFEKAISLCENEIIFLSDQDDVWKENKVERILFCFEKHPEIDVVSTNGCCLSNNAIDCNRISVWDIPDLLDTEKTDYNYFEIISSITNIATGATMAVRKDFIVQILPFLSYEDFHHDEWIALNASFRESFFFFPEKLLLYRTHAGQQVGEDFFKLKKESLLGFTALYRKSEFKNLKFILKIIAINYYRKINILNNCNIGLDAKQLLEKAVETDKNNFFKAKAMMKKYYPIKFLLLNVSDRFTGKRKLK
ncbi:MAG: glycosyltransferase family 2 protein [Bergeyella sp.]